MLQAINAEGWHIAMLAPALREADKQEIYATSGKSGLEGLRLSYDASPVRYSIMEGEEPVAMFGVCPDSDNSGVVWLLASDALKHRSTQFLRESKKYIDTLHEEANADLLWNLTDKRNVVHHKWLRWCGFSFIREVQWGPFGMPFYEFGRYRNV